MVARQVSCVTASDVGVPIRFALISSTFVLNPRVLQKSQETTWVPHEDDATGKWTRSQLPRWVNVTYLGSGLDTRTETWYGEKAECLSVNLP